MNAIAAPSHEDKNVLTAFKPYEHFCKSMLDAFIVVDAAGQVLKNNALFTQLVGKSSKQIQKAESLDELIHFFVDSKPISVKDLLKNQNPMRIDEVRGKTDTQDDLNLILGIYPFLEGPELIGMFMLIRDVTAETNLQDKYKVKATQSITDRLTGLYNRGFFDSTLPEMIKNLGLHRRENDQKTDKLSIIMADIDHFKKINDSYGHQGGDFVLEKIAGIFRSKFRKSDIPCRYGGEEFLVILPDTDETEAFSAAEKIRHAVKTFVFDFNGTIIPVSISMGIAQHKIGEEAAEKLLARADEALYFSKEHGRNKVSIHKADGSIK